MSTIEKSPAIILKRHKLRETSLIITTFTSEFGKVSGVVKGVRGNLNKTFNALDVFSLSDIVFYKRKRGSLYTISQCDLANYYKGIRASYERIIYALYFVDLLDAVTQAEDKNEELFELTLKSLQALDEGRDPQAIKTIFEIKTLILSGFKPRIDACLKCGGPVEQAAVFNTNAGGLMCRRCASGVHDILNIFKGTIASMLHIERSDLESVWRLNLTPKVRSQLNSILDNFIRVHIDKHMRSHGFIAQAGRL